MWPWANLWGKGIHSTSLFVGRYLFLRWIFCYPKNAQNCGLGPRVVSNLMEKKGKSFAWVLKHMCTCYLKKYCSICGNSHNCPEKESGTVSKMNVNMLNVLLSWYWYIVAFRYFQELFFFLFSFLFFILTGTRKLKKNVKFNLELQVNG